MAQSHPLHGDHLNIELFRYLCRLNRITDSGTLPFLVPDTVIFNNARATQWFSFDAESGTLGRRPSKQLDRQIIFQEFSQLNKHDRSEICACFTTFHDCKLQSLYFTEKTLHSFLFGPSGGPSEELQLLTTAPANGSSGGSDGGAGHSHAGVGSSSSSSTTPRIGILQKFIEPNKDNNEVFQVAWSPRMTYILRRYSKKRLIDRLAEPIARAATFDGPSTLSEEVYAGPGTKTVVEPFVKALVDHIRGADSGRYTVGRCLLFFKVDRLGQMWFLYNTSMRIIVDEEDRRSMLGNTTGDFQNDGDGENTTAVSGLLGDSSNINKSNITGTGTSSKRAGVDEYGQVKYQLHEPEFHFSPGLPKLKDLERLQIVPHIDSPIAAMLGLDEEKLQALSDRIQVRQAALHEQAQRQQAQLAIAGGSSSPARKGQNSSPSPPAGGRNVSSYSNSNDDNQDLSALLEKAGGQDMNQTSAYSIKSPTSFPRRHNNEDMYPVHFRAKWDRAHLEALHFNPPPVRPNLEPLILSLQKQENAGGIDLSEAWDRSDEGANADHERLLYLLSLSGPLTKRELVRSRKVGQKGVAPLPGWNETKERLFPSKKKKRTSSSASLMGPENTSSLVTNSPASVSHIHHHHHQRAGSSSSPNANTIVLNQSRSGSATASPRSRSPTNSHSQSRRHYRAKHHVGVGSGASVRRSPSSLNGSGYGDDVDNSSFASKKSAQFKRRVMAGEGISPALLSRFLTPSIDKTVERSNYRIEKMEAAREEIRREKEKIRQEMKRIGAPPKKVNARMSQEGGDETERNSVPLSAQYSVSSKHRHKQQQNEDEEQQEQQDQQQRNEQEAIIKVRDINNTTVTSMNDEDQHQQQQPTTPSRPTSARKSSEVVSADLVLVNMKEPFVLKHRVRNAMLIVKRRGSSSEEQVIDLTEQVNDFYSLLRNKGTTPSVKEQQQQQREASPTSTTATTTNGDASFSLNSNANSNLNPEDTFNLDASQDNNNKVNEEVKVDGGMISLLDENNEDQKSVYNELLKGATDDVDEQQYRVLMWYTQRQHQIEDEDKNVDKAQGNTSAQPSPAKTDHYEDDFDEISPEKNNDSKKNTTESDENDQTQLPILEEDNNNNNDKQQQGVSSPLVTGSLRGQHPSAVSSNNNNLLTANHNNNNNPQGATLSTISYASTSLIGIGRSGRINSQHALSSNTTTAELGSIAARLGLHIFVTSGKAAPQLPPTSSFSDSFIVAFKLFAQSSLAAANRDMKSAEQAVTTVAESLMPLLVASRENVRLESKYDPRRVNREQTILSKNVKVDRDTENETVALVFAAQQQDEKNKHPGLGMSSNTDANMDSQLIAEKREDLTVNKIDAGWILDSNICHAAFNAGFAVLKFDELLALERVSHDFAQRKLVEELEEEARFELIREEDGDFSDLHQIAWREETRILDKEEEEKMRREREQVITAALERRGEVAADVDADADAMPRKERTVSIVEQSDENQNTPPKPPVSHDDDVSPKDDDDDPKTDLDAPFAQQPQNFENIEAVASFNNNNSAVDDPPSSSSQQQASPQHQQRRPSRRVSIAPPMLAQSGVFVRSFRLGNRTSSFAQQQHEESGEISISSKQQQHQGGDLFGSNEPFLERRNNMWKNYDPGRRSSVFAPVDKTPTYLDSAASNQQAMTVDERGFFGDEDDNDDENNQDENSMETANTSRRKNFGIPGTTSTATIRLRRRSDTASFRQLQSVRNIHIVIQIIDPLLADHHTSSSEGRMALRRFTDEALHPFRHGLDEEQKRYNDITTFFNFVKQDISQSGGIVTPRTRAANEKAQQQVLLQQQISAKEVHLMPAPHGPYHVLVPGVPKSASEILLHPNKKNSTTSLGANLSIARSSASSSNGGGGPGNNAAAKAAAGAAEAISRKNAAPPRRGGMTKAELRQHIALCTFRGMFGVLEEYRRRYKNYHHHVNSEFSWVFDKSEGIVLREDDPVRFPSYQQQQQKGRAWGEEKVFSQMPAQALTMQLTSLQPGGGKDWWCRRC